MSSFPSKLKLRERHYITEKQESNNTRWNTRMALKDGLKEEENDGDDNDNDSSEEKNNNCAWGNYKQEEEEKQPTKREK